VATPKEQVEQFLRDTDLARRLSQKCRDYFDHKQWTAEQEAKLAERRQAAIVVNRIKPKVEGLVGLYEMRKSDPKAFPRTKKHESAAYVVTDALRFVADNTDFQMTRLNVAEDFFVEGYGGVMADVSRRGDAIEIRANQLPWDRIYFDSHSRRFDFKDARFMGLWLWMDEDQAKDTFKISKKKLDQMIDTPIDGEETNEDRPRWTEKQDGEKRVRIAMHFHIVKSVWKMTIFSGDVTILKTQDSPFLDEHDQPMNPIELVGSNIDRENNRYGEVAGFLSQQDEINHRRSKFLHRSSVRTTFGNDNAIQDVESAKRELRKPDGHVKINGTAKFGEDFGIIPQQDMANAEFNLYIDAKSELDAVSMNAQLAGDRQSGDLSGTAIGKLQQAGTVELARQYALLAGWERRVYEQMWARVKQFWGEEKWIRVTDDQDALRWVGLNSQITAQQLLQENIEDDSLPLEQRRQSEQILQFLIQTENPKLNEVVETRNQTAELEVDITIDQSFDVMNIQEEQFKMLSEFAQGTDMDIIDLIEMSQLRGKKEVIEKITRRRQGQAQAQQAADQQAQQIEVAKATSKVRKEDAETQKISAEAVTEHIEAMGKQLENIQVANNPDPNPQVHI
jgi:hypothetical protein|tara:strand:- start:8589 stop:10448 length:1860 start_codon:yes stop_codon:yes gene_type:complete